MKCKLCRGNLTKENRHYIHRQICLTCVVQRMHEGRQAKRDAQAEAEIRRSLQQDFQGPHYNVPKCECGEVLLPGAFYKHNRQKCKKCHLEAQEKMGGSCFCKSCKQHLPLTQFIEGNRSTCRPCLKKYKARRWEVLKACRD